MRDYTGGIITDPTEADIDHIISIIGIKKIKFYILKLFF